MSKLNQDSLQQPTAQSVVRRVSLEKVGLPPLTFKQSNAGSSFIYLSKTKGSLEVLGKTKLSSRTVGTIPEGKSAGKILFKEDFVAAFPILKEGYVERYQQGGYSFVYTSESSEIPNYQYTYAEVVNQSKGRPRLQRKKQEDNKGSIQWDSKSLVQGNSKNLVQGHSKSLEQGASSTEQESKICTCACQHKEDSHAIDFTPLPNDDVEIITALFKALADPTRFNIVYVLLQRKQLSVGEISQVTKMSMSAVSHQLALLRMQKLVKVARDGVKNYYSLCDDHVSKLIELAIEHIHE